MPPDCDVLSDRVVCSRNVSHAAVHLLCACLGLFEESRGDIVFGLPCCVFRGAWCVDPSL